MKALEHRLEKPAKALLLFAFSNLWAWSLQASSPADRMLDWTPVIGEAIQTSTAAPCLASRNLAIIYTSAFEAANAPAPRYRSYLRLPAPKTANIFPELASLSALNLASKTLFPSQKGHFSKLYNAQLAELQALVPEESWSVSIEFGESAAKEMLAHRSDDGSTSSQTYYPRDEIGKWKRTPPSYRPPELSYWQRTRPFALESSDQFRLPPPYPLDSPEYAAALQEVREFGAIDSKVRTEDQTEIAKFWSCFSYTSTPAGHWFEIASRTASEKEMDLLDSLRLLALINLSMADAGIACWDTKYHYESWRPIQAIRQADQDGNPATQPDPDWNSLLESPPHPEYTSGHGAFSGAGGRIMELFFEKDGPYSFSTTSSSLPGVVRSYSSIAECTDEICDSRLYGGIHFQYSNLRGRDLGELVADYVYERLLLPLP